MRTAHYTRFLLLAAGFMLLSCSKKAQAGIPEPPKYDMVVAQDGTGDFTTLQAAFNAVPDYRKKNTVIFVKKGRYKEKLVLAESKNLVTIIGEDMDSTILTYDDYAQKLNAFGEEKGTSGSASFYVYGKDFTADNITFENSAGPVGQAVAILVAGDRARFIRCRFLGFQDTLYTYGHESRQFYKDCYIEGTVDFIFGSSTAWFENCTIFCKKNGYVTAASTPQHKKYGYVFMRCRIVSEAAQHSFYLGRPWRPYARTVFLHTEMAAHIKPEGWHNWGKVENESTVFYAEYKSSGPGAQALKRVSWSRQLTDQEAGTYTLQEVMGDWDPLLGL